MTNGINTREMILEILLQIDEEGEHSHIAIRNALSKYQFLPKQERAFVTRVCEGTLEYRIYIDYIINSFSKITAVLYIRSRLCRSFGIWQAIL